MFSRYLVIVLAAGAAVLQASRGAWIETAGLTGLAGGLVLLKLAETRPALKRAAYAAFVITAVAMAVVFLGRL